MSTWELFAQQASDDRPLRNFYPALLHFIVCGPDPIYHVRVTLDPEGAYWGWLYSDHPDNLSSRNKISMIFADLRAVEICFPYGTKAEEDRGRGKVVRLSVERLERA